MPEVPRRAARQNEARTPDACAASAARGPSPPSGPRVASRSRYSRVAIATVVRRTSRRDPRRRTSCLCTAFTASRHVALLLVVPGSRLVIVAQDDCLATRAAARVTSGNCPSRTWQQKAALRVRSVVVVVIVVVRDPVHRPLSTRDLRLRRGRDPLAQPRRRLRLHSGDRRVPAIPSATVSCLPERA
jgi:hypothetical protein